MVRALSKRPFGIGGCPHARTDHRGEREIREGGKGRSPPAEHAQSPSHTYLLNTLAHIHHGGRCTWLLEVCAVSMQYDMLIGSSEKMNT